MAIIDKLWKKITDIPYRSDITMNELDKVLRHFGVQLVRQESSHRIYKHPRVNGILTIPCHTNNKTVLPAYVKNAYEYIMKNELS